MSAPGFVALLLAAGRGTRLGGPVPKTWLSIDDVPIVTWSARRLARVPGHRGTILAVDEDSLERRVPTEAQRLRSAGVLDVLTGGDTRQESCRKAYRATRGIDAEIIAVHDAARPFFSLAAMARAVVAARDHGGAILGHRARDTLKRIDENGRVEGTVARDVIFQAATPQVFRRDAFEAMLAHAAAHDVQGTDEAGLAEACGVDVIAIEAPSTNVKLTFPEDLLLIPSLRPLLDESLPVEDDSA